MSSQNSNPGRRYELMPAGASRKRNDRDVFDAQGALVTTKTEPAPPPAAQRQQAPQPPQPTVSGNRLLAGYLAHEFLTRGTLFGQRWDPSAASAAAAAAKPALLSEPQQLKQKLKKPAQAEPKQGKPPTVYAEVAYLLKMDGAHIPGVVNPTQLARLLQL